MRRASRAAKAPPRAWQRMLSGRRLDLLDPSPMDIEIEDIAHGLARVARWNGQTVGDHPMSVAQHSVVVEEILAHIEPGIDPRWRLAALLHDAAEYVIGDMISPFKAALGLDYETFEDRLAAAIHIRFGLPARTPPNDQDPDQVRRPRLRLLRGDPAGRLRPRRIPHPVRQTAAGLRAPHRSPPRPRGPGALSDAPPHPAGGHRPDRRRRRLRHRMTALSNTIPIVIGLSAVIVALARRRGLRPDRAAPRHPDRRPLRHRRPAVRPVRSRRASAPSTSPCATTSPVRPGSTSAMSSSSTPSATRAATRRWPTSAPAPRG